MLLSNQIVKVMATNSNPQHTEGKVATAIEEQTAKLPSDLFLWTAIGAIAVSAVLQLLGGTKKNKNLEHRSLFVGQWVAPFLILGLYNKLVKLEGHD
jgi:formate-dependent nitrite reductase membrane component NrfD